MMDEESLQKRLELHSKEAEKGSVEAAMFLSITGADEKEPSATCGSMTAMSEGVNRTSVIAK